MTRTFLALSGLAMLVGCGSTAEALRPYGANIPASTVTAQNVSWITDARDWRGMNGTRIRFDCPGGGTTGTVYGSDLYTDDSSVCTAGVHAGRINFTGGPVVIEIRAAASSYAASTRYGVGTNAYAAYDGSYIVL